MTNAAVDIVEPADLAIEGRGEDLRDVERSSYIGLGHAFWESALIDG